MMAYSGHIMTLANSIIGVGILAMPFCFQKCGIILSVLLLIISNWITRICCHYLIKSSLLTRRKSFEMLGFHAFGASGKLLVELCIIGYLFGTSITYFVVMGDLGPQIASKMFSLNIADFPHLRTWVMIGITIFCILPLAMLKNVDSLQTVCAASIGFYVCLVLKIVLESEQHIVEHDWVDKVEYWRPAGILQCLPIFSMALSCQILDMLTIKKKTFGFIRQLFEVFESINNQSIEKLNGIVRNATWICTFVYIAVGFFGYVAFCTQSFSGNILMNFSPSFGSDVIKIGFVLSVAFSFPLVIFPCRVSLYSLLYRKGHTDNTGYIPETRFKLITTCLVSSSLGIALLIPSVELIIGLVGSTIGVAICIMFPALCFRKIVTKQSTERALAQFIYVGGFCLMILGTVANLNAIDERHSGAHLRVIEEFDDAMLVRPAVKVTEIPLNSAYFQPQRDVGNIVMEPQEKDEKKEPSEKAKDATAGQLNSQQDVEVKSKQHIISKKDDDILRVIAPKSADELKGLHNTESNKQHQLENPPKLDIKPLQLNPPSNLLSPQQESNHLEQQNMKQQTINKDAIKKDEDIADEELKNMQKLTKNKKDVELKETQKELKQTKELLERTVDQLKHELAKQKEETENFVAEKLEEVVQKVEQIEKKVKQHDESAEVLVPKQSKGINNNKEQANIPKESGVLGDVPKILSKSTDVKKRTEERPLLLNILSEQVVNDAADKRMQQQKAYEPLSSKTGELIEQVKNYSSNLEQPLPQPLAVLFNVSNIKTNIHARDRVYKPLNTSQSNTNDTIIIKNSNTENSTLVKLVPTPTEKEKENVEAIRRDILNLSALKHKEFPSLALTINNIESDSKQVAENVQHLRRKRSSAAIHLNESNFDGKDAKLHNNNCLPEPTIEALLVNGGLSSSIDFKIQNIGRELRSVNDDNDMKN
ncbi:putative sodium-coupled neutral amino acid transporter 10 isoform X2 [Eurosta solidaginis]|uniref:putative sodium-coupled neutral amino acid transporter 10 isoform X2 n=1 Tax=Eurosta solidaginis TaxID=178769 RepID=UPI003530661F